MGRKHVTSGRRITNDHVGYVRHYETINCYGYHESPHNLVPRSPTAKGKGKRSGHEISHLAPVVQSLDSAIHPIYHYPADKYYGNQLRYPLDSDLSGG